MRTGKLPINLTDLLRQRTVEGERIDEAQEMNPVVLSELRLLASARFDSQPLLCTILAGDGRLPEKLRREELIPLGSRIRTRLVTEFADKQELLACLQHLMAGAGNATLMTEGC